MTFTDKDLEAILKVALERASRSGINPQAFETIYRGAVEEVVGQKARDVAELYASLQVDAFYIESFQMKTSTKGVSYEGGGTDWYLIRDRVNKEFGTNLSELDRGDHQVYVWLEKEPSGKGVLHSYGNAHRDDSHRLNIHYFRVWSDFDQLIQVVNSFISNPAEMSKFNAVIFNWENQNPPKTWGQPDLFTEMKELYVHTPGVGEKKVVVK